MSKYVYLIITIVTITILQLIHFISANTILIQLIPIFLAVGIVVGVLGSTLSLRKYLKV